MRTQPSKPIVRWFTRPVLPCAQFPSGLAGCLVIHRNGVDDAMYDVVASCNWYEPHKPHEPLQIRSAIYPAARGSMPVTGSWRCGR